MVLVSAVAAAMPLKAGPSRLSASCGNLLLAAGPFRLSFAEERNGFDFLFCWTKEPFNQFSDLPGCRPASAGMGGLESEWAAPEPPCDVAELFHFLENFYDFIFNISFCSN